LADPLLTKPLQLDDIVRSDSKVVGGWNLPASVPPATIVRRLHRQRGGSSVPDAPIEDHVHVGIVPEAFLEVCEQPRVIARHDKQVPHHYRTPEVTALGTF
jgi:hypothetical protein